MGERVSFESASGELTLPKKSGKVPAVVLIQEWWGLNDHIRSLADRLANEGFLVVAPDLFHGKTTKDAGEAAKLMTELDKPKAVKEIAAAVHYLAKHERSNGNVGVIGFCLGGALTLAAAANVPEVKAVTPFYGLSDGVDYGKIKAPVQMHVAK